MVDKFVYRVSFIFFIFVVINKPDLSSNFNKKSNIYIKKSLINSLNLIQEKVRR